MKKLFGILALAVLGTIPTGGYALPFNDDMVDVQPRAGALMRPKDERSIPVGSLANVPRSQEQALTLENPVKGDADSASIGARLFRINCFPCHGDISNPGYKPMDAASKTSGPVAQIAPIMLPPDITEAAYREGTFSDGQIYSTIHFGVVRSGVPGRMPALGWKLSPREHWDIVNYVRSVQAKRAPAAAR